MKVILIGGRGTAIVIADQIHDANKRYGMDIEVLVKLGRYMKIIKNITTSFLYTNCIDPM